MRIAFPLKNKIEEFTKNFEEIKNMRDLMERGACAIFYQILYYQVNIKDPRDLKKRITHYLKELDELREEIIDEGINDYLLKGESNK